MGLLRRKLRRIREDRFGSYSGVNGSIRSRLMYLRKLTKLLRRSAGYFLSLGNRWPNIARMLLAL